VDRRDCLHPPHLPALGIRGQEGGVLDRPGQAVVQGADQDHRVELEEGQVGELVLGEALGAESREDQADPAEALGSGTPRAEVGQEDPGGVADHDLVDLALAVEEDPEPTTGLAGQLRQAAGEGRADELLPVHPAPIERLEGLGVGGGEPDGAAEEGDQGGPPGKFLPANQKRVRCLTEGSSVQLLAISF
jgi:hypothetical protein